MKSLLKHNHDQRIKTIRKVSDELGIHIGILQDLQGPKIRLGRFKDGPVNVKNGDKFILTSKNIECNQNQANVTYDKLAEEVKVGNRILLDDGRVEMKVEEVDQKEQRLVCSITVGGVLSNNKGVNFPDVQLSIRALTDKDKVDLEFGLKQGFKIANFKGYIDYLVESLKSVTFSIFDVNSSIQDSGFDQLS